jgi:molecular chaperone DnaK
MSKTVGIDLGTTNSCVAILEGGDPQILVNRDGDRTTPSVVHFKEGQRLVGKVARRQAVMSPKSTIYSAKRFMGRKFSEIQEEAKGVPYEVTSGPQDAVRLQADGKTLSPEEVGSIVLRKLAEDASAYLGEKVTKAVITVPAYFNDAQRQATRDAGKIAGLEVLRVVNEPTAAALAYGLENGQSERVLVFDLGGGTFDVSILDVGDGVCEVLATAGDSHLGGDDFDQAVVEWMAQEFQSQHGIDLRQDPQAFQRLTEAAEQAKKELSSSTTTEINLPYLTADANGPKHLTLSLTRARFDQLTSHLVERCLGPIEQALKDSKLKAKEIDQVLLVGGSTRIPAVQELVRKLTGGKKPNMSVNPDEVVALGAAVQAGIIEGKVEDVLLLDVTPLSVGLETLGGVMTKIIERNTAIPCRRSEVFSTAADNQSAVDIVLLQGEREMSQDNRKLGQFRLEGIRPAPRGMPQIEVHFDMDADGILKVTAQDKETGKEQTITISGSTSLEKEEIDHLVKEAETHATEDRQRRMEIDDRNAADALVYQAERSLGDLGEQVPSHEKMRAEGLMGDLRSALKEQKSIETIRSLKSDLEQLLHGLASRAAASQPSGPQPSNQRAPSYSCPDDDVIDAEFSAG